MTDINLSPSAQAVLDALLNTPVNSRQVCDGRASQIKLAAAFRAAADVITPAAEVKPQENLESRREAMVWGMNHQTQLIRQQLFAIAEELNDLSRR